MKRYFMAILVLSLLNCNGTSNGKKETKEIETENNNDPYNYDYGMINPEAPKQTIEFGQLVGLWDCVSKDLVKDENGNEKWYTNKAFWKWEYILGGHAILNNWWQEDNSPNAVTKEYFASGVFIFNPETALWEITVMNSRPHKLSSQFQGNRMDDNLKISDTTKTWQITFHNITNDSFQWKYDIVTEEGNWKTLSEISAKKTIETE
ncbi:hypothetical protein [uncultured Psychroserpens sp.]|uniref:hypothetical protein n=1 Tax=uncultured Psychroserpens sp. TaxID=255436 RepID=UPI002627E1D6|nr:hypothetical protein [uncultured Psychroserpens sp.]